MYFLHLEPEAEDPNEFAVVSYYRDSSERRNVEIIRIDTAHGFTHIDRLYLENQGKEEVEWGLWEAVEDVTENWRRYARLYEDNHG